MTERLFSKMWMRLTHSLLSGSFYSSSGRQVINSNVKLKMWEVRTDITLSSLCPRRFFYVSSTIYELCGSFKVLVTYSRAHYLCAVLALPLYCLWNCGQVSSVLSLSVSICYKVRKMRLFVKFSRAFSNVCGMRSPEPLTVCSCVHACVLCRLALSCVPLLFLGGVG